jgi:hypothetical protein
MICQSLLRQGCALIVALCILCAANNAQSAPFTLQIKAERNQASAASLVEQLKSQGIAAYSYAVKLPGQGLFYRVRVGRFATLADARQTGEELRRSGLANDYFVTKYDAAPRQPTTAPEVARARPEPLAESTPMPTASVEPTPENTSNSATATWQEGKLGIESRYWFTSLRAFASLTETINATDVSFRLDPNLRSKNIPQFRLNWHPTRRSRVRLDYTGLSASGNSLQFDIGTPGENYNFAANAITRLEVKQASLSYTWQGLNFKNKIRFGPLVEVRGIWLNAELQEVNNGLRSTLTPRRRAESFAVALPGFGADLSVALHPKVSFFATGAGFPSGRYGHLVDGEAGFKLAVAPNFNLTGGYRVLEFRARESEDFARLRLNGAFIGAEFLLGRRTGSGRD